MIEELMKKDWLSIKEAAEFLNVSTKTIRRKIASKELKATKVGGRWRIKVKDLLKFMGEAPDETYNQLTNIINFKIKELEEKIDKIEKFFFKFLKKHIVSKLTQSYILKEEKNFKKAFKILKDIEEELFLFPDLKLQAATLLWEIGAKKLSLKWLYDLKEEYLEAKLQIVQYLHELGKTQEAIKELKTVDMNKLNKEMKDIVELLLSLLNIKAEELKN